MLAKAAEHEGGAVDLSIGTPCDPPPAAVIAALAPRAATARGLPAVHRHACAFRGGGRRTGSSGAWGPSSDARTELAACVGTKEFVASTPQYLRLRSPERDTVLYPAISYPTYEMGAILAGCRAVPVHGS